MFSDQAVGRRSLVPMHIDLEPDQIGADGNRLTDRAARLDDPPGNDAWDCDGCLVSHHVDQRLIFVNNIANLDVPGDDFTLDDTLAEIR